MKKYNFYLNIISVLILILLLGFFTFNVKATNSTLDFIFEKDVLYDNDDNPSYNQTFNVRNQTQFTGHYNATYSFENDTDGSNPTNFNVDESGGFINVISSLDGHDKIVEMNDTSDSLNIVLDVNVSRVSGTYEYWIRFSQTNAYLYHYILETDTTKAINLQWTNAGELKYYDTDWNIIDTYILNVWYHVSIDFECGTGGYLGLNEDKFNIRINNEQMGPYDMRGNPTTMEKIQWYTGGSTVGINYVDALGYWDVNYTIGNNIMPIIETNISIQEPDKWDFYYEGINDILDDGDDNPNGWNDVESDAEDNVNCRYESIVEIISNSGQTNGINKINFAIPYSKRINVSFGFKILDIESILNNDVYMKIYSYDETEVVRIRINDNGDLKYWISGTTYNTLDTGIIINKNYYFNLFLHYEMNVCILKYYTDGIYTDTFMFPLTTSNKIGLNIVSFLACADTDLIKIYLDYIGVYVDGSSITTEFGSMGCEVGGKGNTVRWEFNENTFLFVNLIGDSLFLYLDLADYISTPAPGYDPKLIEGEKTYAGWEMFNMYNYVYDDYWKNDFVVGGVVWVHFYDTLQFKAIRIEGIKLIEGINAYWLEFSSANVDTIKSNFWVDSNNRLQFNLTVDDDNLEYIQATFNIDNVPSENRSISFRSNINGEAKGYLSLDYNDDTMNIIEFPFHDKITKVLLPQFKIIDKFTILITDNNKDDNDFCFGYISEIQLIYNPDVQITVLTLTLIEVIIPLIVLIIPSIIMSKKFGVIGAIITFILMSLICVIANLIPIWLFFVIIFSSITFLIVKKKEGVIK